jgi:hypothetical protein
MAGLLLITPDYYLNTDKAFLCMGWSTTSDISQGFYGIPF